MWIRGIFMVAWGKEELTTEGGKQGPVGSMGTPTFMISLNVNVTEISFSADTKGFVFSNALKIPKAEGA